MDLNAPISSWAHPAPEEIRSAHAQLAALEAKLLSRLKGIDAIRHRIAHLKRFTAPIRRVPPEILGRIITLAATAPGAPAQVLRTLSSVCSFWRGTTLNTPEAWSKIHFCHQPDEPLHGPRLWLRTLHNLQEWFRNSGRSKKEVRVAMIGSMNYLERRTLMRLIAAHSDTLRVLVVQNAQPDDLDVLLANPMPFLEEWAMYTERTITHVDFPSLHLAPRLQRLSLDNDLDCLPSTQRAGMTQLELIPTQSSDRALLKGLSLNGGFSALRVLDVCDVGRMARSSIGIELTLPELEVLRMDLVIKSRMTRLFSWLKLPKLTTLALQSARGYGEPSEHPDQQAKEMALLLQTLIDTSRPPLRRLFLECFAITEHDMIASLNLLPLLERLVLLDMRTVEFQDNFPTHFIGPQDSSTPDWLCPRLTHMAVLPLRQKPRGLTLVEYQRLIAARAVEAERSGGAVARLQRLRFKDAEMVQSDGTWSWVADQEDDNMYIVHPRIFRGAYRPAERWWCMERCILDVHDSSL